MNSRIWLMISTGLLSVGLCCAQAGESSVGVDVDSAYVWRGVTRNDGAVVQPWLDLEVAEGFGIHVWGNLDLDDYDGAVEEGEFSEFDITLSYIVSAGRLEYGFGYVEYLFPHSMTNETEGGTREMFGLVGVDLGRGFSAKAQVYYDFDEVEDFYGNLSLVYGRELAEGLRTEVAGSLGYAGEDMAAGEDGGWHEYTLSAGLAWDVKEAVTCGMRLAYTDSLDEDVLLDQDVGLYGGLNVAYEF